MFFHPTACKDSTQGDGYVTTWGYGIYEWNNLAATFDSSQVKGPLTSSSGNVRGGSSGHGIPEFPFQLIATVTQTAVIVIPYLFVAKRERKRS
ncbi:MAG: hypothetical protein JRN20_03565 [Nitrososphaerota archaeon]|nr:hypothetical protein [Nitrososphaerota archaeon]